MPFSGEKCFDAEGMFPGQCQGFHANINRLINDDIKLKKVKGKILILDDDEMIRLFLEKAIVNLGYTVVSTSIGEETINLFKEYYSRGEKFDLVILDIIIPGGYGGKDVVKIIKLIDNSIKVIASSGYSDDPVMSDFKKYGFDDIMPKPYGFKELSEKIFKILQK